MTVNNQRKIGRKREAKPAPDCSIKNGKVTPCAGLSSVLQYGGRGTRYQGVEMQSFVNMKTMKFTRNLVILKSGEHGKRGVVMNFCPFCRGQLHNE